MIRASTKLAQNYKKKQTELHILKIEIFFIIDSKFMDMAGYPRGRDQLAGVCNQQGYPVL